MKNRPCKSVKDPVFERRSRPFYILKSHRLKAHFVEISSFQSIFSGGSCMGQNLLYTRTTYSVLLGALLVYAAIL